MGRKARGGGRRSELSEISRRGAPRRTSAFGSCHFSRLSASSNPARGRGDRPMGGQGEPRAPAQPCPRGRAPRLSGKAGKAPPRRWSSRSRSFLASLQGLLKGFRSDVQTWESQTDGRDEKKRSLRGPEL